MLYFRPGMEVAFWQWFVGLNLSKLNSDTRSETEVIIVVTRFWLSATSIKMNNIKHALMGRKNVMFVGLSISEIFWWVISLSEPGILGYQSFVEYSDNLRVR